MKFKEVKEKKQEELREMLKNLRIKLGKLLFDLNSNSLKDFSQVQKTKKDIARILTALKLTVSN
ncbi:MAG: 50S ribosomal protein L29 [Candidatus Yanofskybacteria bacterium]|nr:50S ribosomal protein L29 [Candidatus Yanofskybacteria bacterium]